MDCICRPSRIMAMRINLLDETEFMHEIKDDLPGQALLDVVFGRLNLIETSYFGIRYIDEENQTHWLDPASRISRQLKPRSDPFDLYFGVKFYTADPCKLLEEITRYQLFLQVKQDVLQGRLPVPFELAAELGAFVVQSELGDYDARRHSKGYVSEFRLLPNQSNDLETRVAELHQQLKGMPPASAELNYLDKVKWHDMYGVDLHPVLGEDSVEYFLGLTPSGVVVLRNKTTVAHYYWPRIAKVYYKGRYFMLRISDKNNELNTYGFETPRKSACKHLWRCCVEHHAFFRLVRVAPLPSSQSTTSDLFQLSSRLRYSGRSEKQAAKDALSIGRTPPAFTRLPSKRQPRRLIDDFLNGSKNAESYKSVAVNAAAMFGKGSAGLQPTAPRRTNFESPYLSTYSIPTSLGIRPYHQQQSNNGYHTHSSNNHEGGSSNLQTPDSPRSTRSAPWPRSQQRSLFGNNPASPRSVRSASTSGRAHRQQKQQSRHHASGGGEGTTATHHQHRFRSSSVESQSSNDSRSTRRNKHRHRRTSDNESELSRGSGRSGRSHHRKHRRSRHRRDSAGSDRGSSRGRSYSGHRASSGRSGSTELIDSTSQWREAQRRQAEVSLGQGCVQQASVSKSSMVARSLHSNDSHSDTHSHHKSRRHRKNKSPSDSRNRIWSSELTKHLQFGLVDTAGMSEDQLREIPYTVVETNSKRSNSNLKIHKSSSKSSVGGKSSASANTLTNGSGGGHSVASSGQKNRVDRIRGSNPNESTGTKNGSIRSASTISSRECERNNGLVRMMSSMSMGDFISPTGSNLSPQENSALRVSHEHTDSGLGADQDYAYSSERSSDSTRYGTNKSSGASSGSHCKSAFGSNNGGPYNNLMHHQTVSSQQQQKRQNSFYAQRQQQQQQQPLAGGVHSSIPHPATFKHPPSNVNQSVSLAPIHITNHSNTSPRSTNHPNNNNSAGNEKHSSSASTTTASSHSSTASASMKTTNNRLLNYTTFENNQYKFSLNNVFGGNNGAPKGGAGGGGGVCNTNLHLDSFLEMPHSAAAPYYYNGPPTTSVYVKKRDAKSDIGVPTRRASGVKALTKMQLLTGQATPPSATAYCPLAQSPSYAGGLAARLHPAKSDLFLSYMNTSAGAAEYERPHIYNYKMPQMPEFLRQSSAQQPPMQQPQQQNSAAAAAAYHISGVQTADLPPSLYKPATSNNMMYAGGAPANDVLYYQFDNGQHAAAPRPIVQQPKTSSVGPLVFLQHGGPHATPAALATTQASSAMQQTHRQQQQQQQNRSPTHSKPSALSSVDGESNRPQIGARNSSSSNNNNAGCNIVKHNVDEVDDDDDVDNRDLDDDYNTDNHDIDDVYVGNHDDDNHDDVDNDDDDDNDDANDDDADVDDDDNDVYDADTVYDGFTPGSSKSIKSTSSTQRAANKTNQSTSVSVSVSSMHPPTASPVAKHNLHNNNNNNINSNCGAYATSSSTNHRTNHTNNSNNTLNANTLNRMRSRNRAQARHQIQNQIPNQNPALTQNRNSTSIQNQNQNSNISSSLEIILSPIIQSSRRAQ